jgi:hypothetical protein
MGLAKQLFDSIVSDYFLLLHSKAISEIEFLGFSMCYGALDGMVIPIPINKLSKYKTMLTELR